MRFYPSKPPITRLLAAPPTVEGDAIWRRHSRRKNFVQNDEQKKLAIYSRKCYNSKRREESYRLPHSKVVSTTEKSKKKFLKKVKKGLDKSSGICYNKYRN